MGTKGNTVVTFSDEDAYALPKPNEDLLNEAKRVLLLQKAREINPATKALMYSPETEWKLGNLPELTAGAITQPSAAFREDMDAARASRVALKNLDEKIFKSLPRRQQQRARSGKPNSFQGFDYLLDSVSRGNEENIDNKSRAEQIIRQLLFEMEQNNRGGPNPWDVT